MLLQHSESLSESINDVKESDPYSLVAVGLIIANFQVLLVGLAWTDGKFGLQRILTCGVSIHLFCDNLYFEQEYMTKYNVPVS